MSSLGREDFNKSIISGSRENTGLGSFLFEANIPVDNGAMEGGGVPSLRYACLTFSATLLLV